MTNQVVSSASSGLVFNNIYTANCSQQYINCIVAAEKAFTGLFSNSVTLNLTFDEEAQGQSGNLASNSWPTWDIVSYEQLKAVLPASDSLPSTDPSGGHTWYVPEAYGRMLGLTSPSPNTDDTVTLNSSYSWNFGQDVTNTVEHEISEGAMGRVGGLGDQNGVWSTMDLFRYSAPGVPDFTDGRDGKTTYFSPDGKTLSSIPYNNQYVDANTRTNQGDPADFGPSDVFGSGFPGETNALSPNDISVMNALGWTPTATPVPPVPKTPPPTPTPPPPPNNFAVLDNTTGVSSLVPGTPYSGPAVGITNEYINITKDNLNISSITPNTYIHSGDGNDGINVSAAGGTNTLDGEGGSNFLVGGTGKDTFFVNDQYATIPSWTTMVGFHAGDAATVWGVTKSDFNLTWVDGGGAAGYTGLTMYGTSASKPEVAITLTGMTVADMHNGTLAVQFGTVASATGTPLNYMEISHL